MNPTRLAANHGPFSSSPSADRYVPLEQFESIIRQSIEGIDREAGPIAILGGPGIGKTMLCMQLEQRLKGRYEVILLSSSQLISRGDLLRTLMYELQLPYRGMMDGELRLGLIERLQHRSHDEGKRLVLIVDEGQALSPRILEELRLLTNIHFHGQPCVSLVLCGSLRLEELLGHPQLDSLQQRISARHFMQPLSASAAAEYLREKLRRSGDASRFTFDRAAADALHLVSGGIPRLLDQTAQRTIQLVAAASSDSMTAVAVEHAWHQLQQPLPPWVAESSIDRDIERDLPIGAASEEIALPARSEEHQIAESKVDLSNRPSVGTPPSAGKGLSSAISTAAAQLPELDREELEAIEAIEAIEAVEAAMSPAVKEPELQKPEVREPEVDALVVELDQAVVGYGRQLPDDRWPAASPPSEDEVQRASLPNAAVRLTEIEDELWQMVANINIESSAIEALLPFEPAPADYGRVEETPTEIPAPRPDESHLLDIEESFESQMDRSSGFSSFVMSNSSQSLFRDFTDQSVGDSIEVGSVAAHEADSSGAAEQQFEDLASLTAAATGHSPLFSLADWEATPASDAVPHDDRDILMIDGGSESDAAAPPSVPAVAGFVPQSYTQLFESLRR